MKIKCKRVLTLALALVFLFCVVSFTIPVSAAGNSLYYGGVLLPAVSTDESFRYVTIFYRTSNDLYVLCKSTSTFAYGGDDPGWFGTQTTYKFELVNDAWVFKANLSSPSFFDSTYDLIYSNYDVYSSDGSDIVFPGMEPSETPLASIEAIDLSRTPSSCYAGLSIAVSVDVTGTGDFEPDCVLTVTGNTSEDTYVELVDSYDTPNLYTLFVGADETAEQLTLTATSKVDSSISATYTVSVLALDEPTVPTEPEDPDDPGNEDPEETVPSPTTGGSGNDSDTEKDQFISEGNSVADEVISIIPDESKGFLDALSSLISVLNYEGTAAVLKMPAIAVPAIPGLFSEIQILEEQELDFEYFVGLMPTVLLTIVRAMFDVAIVGYCLKEFLDLVGSALTGFGGGFSKQLMEE